MYGFIWKVGKAFEAQICQYNDGGGLQRTERFTSKSAAKAWLAQRRVIAWNY